MHALTHPQPAAPPRTAEIISLAEVNRARSHRVLDRGHDCPAETYPWAYCFPRAVVTAGR